MKSSAGFTLIEILVAVVILIAITGLILNTYQGSIRNGQTQAARTHAQPAAQVANTWFAARPDLNAHNYNGLGCMTSKTFTPWGITEGQNATYPTYGTAPTGTAFCYLEVVSSRSMVARVHVNDTWYTEGQ